MNYLNHTLTMLASYGDKTLAQLIVFTFLIKRNFELPILESLMLTSFPCLITLKLSKLQIKSRLKTLCL